MRTNCANLAVVVVAVVAVAAVALATTPAEAGFVVSPGQSATLMPTDFKAPVGEVVATERASFVANYERPDGVTEPFLDQLRGTLTSTVVRDLASGKLTFIYDVDLAGEHDASAASVLSIDGFAGWSTDVAGTLDLAPIAGATRSSDGATLMLNNMGPGGAPRLAVRTNATSYSRRGAARFFATDDVVVQSDDGTFPAFASTEALLGAVPVPSLELGLPPATPIAIPPAAWTVLLTLAGVGVFRVTRGN